MIKNIFNFFFFLFSSLFSLSFDSILYFELLNKSIEPNLFLLRWILCVLNREISLKNIFWIWDCILFYEFMEFTYERNNKDDNIKKDESDKITRLNFLDYICLAMIFDLKKELINV